MQLEEGKDYYLENDLVVMTEHYLISRGYCCTNDCRHCAYGYPDEDMNKNVEGDLGVLEKKAEQEIALLTRDIYDKGLRVLLVNDEIILKSKALTKFAQEHPESLGIFKKRLERNTSSQTTIMYSILVRWANENPSSPYLDRVQHLITSQSVAIQSLEGVSLQPYAKNSLDDD